MTTSYYTATCAICGTNFDARTAYGLCPMCWLRDRLREYDRLRSARYRAERERLDTTLTLLQWLSIASDFNGLCAYCLEVPYSFIEMVNPIAGFTWENVVPICRACAVHKHHSFEDAQTRVQAYLTGERQIHLPRERAEDEDKSYG